jgi:hypothetical protein
MKRKNKSVSTAARLSLWLTMMGEIIAADLLSADAGRAG